MIISEIIYSVGLLSDTISMDHRIVDIDASATIDHSNSSRNSCIDVDSMDVETESMISNHDLTEHDCVLIDQTNDSNLSMMIFS